MIVARLAHPADFAGWRVQARALAERGVAPAEVAWQTGEGQSELFGRRSRPAREDLRPVSVPRRFPELAETVACHRDSERFGLLYRLLWRLQEERRLLDVAADPDVRKAEQMARAVRRDLHKMTAFVRFRETLDSEGEPIFVSWFEPEHHIVERVAPFFTGRFASMRWTILTPERSLHWDGAELHLLPGATRAQAPSGDPLEACWRTYYANIFNPARLKTKAMKAEMPVKYWRNLPEATLIPELVAQAAGRAEAMVERGPATPALRHQRIAERAASEAERLPAIPESWDQAARAARDCTRCGLCRDATQTVFGEGPQDAPVMFVGEQPGDQEDLAGRPFVGPAGQVFDGALGKAGLARPRAYVTNAVKHFKFQLRGKRRIHQKPNAGEVRACRFWLGLERRFIRPKLVVALGATALQALTGRSGALTEARGRGLRLEDGTPLLVTVHPSYLLRLPDEAARAAEQQRFEDDLRRVGALVPELAADG